MLLYMFDLVCKNPIAYNTLKRRFYYQLKKSNISNAPFKSKSVILVSEELEEQADAFFSKWESAIVVFKARTDRVQQFL
jgi:hypothetical protein